MIDIEKSAKYPWQRYWLPAGTEYLFDDYGLPTLRAKDFHRSLIGKTLEDLTSIPCIILLGEPGIGKSTVVAEYSSIPRGADLVCKYNLNRRSAERELFDSIERQPEFASWLAQSDGHLELYLDGLDEAFLNIKTIHNSIIDWLLINKNRFEIFKQSTSKSLRLRITCRSAIWSDETTRNLQEIFGNDGVRLYELAPLTQENVRTAARLENLDENNFLRAIAESESASFAAEPISLKFLISHQKSGRLKAGETNKVKLYEEGCLSLCEELNQSYKIHATISASQRLRLASRLATYMMLTKRSSLVNQLESNLISENDLWIDQIIGDVFKTSEHEDLVSLQSANETLNTRLFTLISEGRYSFKHKTFGEFLAAWHLHQLGIPTNLVQQLLTSGNDHLKAIPLLSEVVTWLATMNKSVFQLLLEHEPYLLLRCNRPFTETEKIALIRSITGLSKRYELIDNLESRKFYPKLKHHQLARQLKSTISNQNLNNVARRIAIAIAGSCQEHGVLSNLLAVMENHSEDLYLRREAMTAVGNLNNKQALNSIIPYALEKKEDDTDDELKGTALSILYPNTLRTRQVLDSLTNVKRENLYGAYKAFLDTLGYQIPSSDIELTLQMLQQDPKFINTDNANEFDDLVSKVIDRCWTLELSSGQLKQFSQLLYKMQKYFKDFEVSSDTDKRRILSKELIGIIDTQSDVFRLFGNGDGQSLIHKEDWPWLVELIRTANDSVKLKIVQILFLMLEYDNTANVNQFLEVVTSRENFLNSFRSFLSIELDSNEALAAKQSHTLRVESLKSRAISKEKIPAISIVQKTHELLEKFSPDELDPFWQIIYFTGAHQSPKHSVHDFEFDVTKLPGWHSIHELHDKVKRAALIYLDKLKPESDWLLSDNFNRKELAGYKALVLLQKDDSNFLESRSEEFWNKWCGVVMFCTFNTINELPNDRTDILSCCFRASRSKFYDILKNFIRYRLEKKQTLHDIYKIKEVADSEIARILLSFLNDTGCSEENSEYIVDFLFQNQVDVIRKFSKTLFRRLVSLNISDSEYPLAVLASSRLLLYPDQSSWNDFWPDLKKHDYVAEAIFLKAAPKLGFGESRQLKLLSSVQKADILSWLYIKFPSYSNQKPRVFKPTDRDDVQYYKTQLLRSLIEEGSVASVNALRRVAVELPEVTEFKWWLLSARDYMKKNTWSTPSPRQLKDVLTNSQNRLVRSEMELLSIVEESLLRLQKKLQGNNPTAFFLWDKSPSKGNKPSKYVPKDENSLSDFIKLHLDYDLVARSLVVNREIEIRRTTGHKDGARPDIYVQAFTHENPSDSFSLVIEVKGCWHPKVGTSMSTQLKDKYLSRYKSNIGLYLVGWYFCRHFPDPKKRSKKSFETKMKHQARQLSQSNVLIKSLIVDCRL